MRKNNAVSRMGVRAGMRRRDGILGSQPASEERKEQVTGPALSRTTTNRTFLPRDGDRSTAGHW